MLTLPAFAKINLGLKIVGRRPDGYHELATVYQTITLHDRLCLEKMRKAAVEVRVLSGGAPEGRRNLVYQALQALRKELGVRDGVYVELEKSIPASSGLGGGSSDAAVALLGCLRLLRRRFPAKKLSELAAGQGADVPFFLLGGRALGRGRGDEISALPDLAPRFCVVVAPGFGIPTRDAYRWASLRLTKRAGASIMARFCRRARSSEWPAALENDFEEVVFSRFPQLGRIKRKLEELGAEWASMSGSGSAMYGLFRTLRKAETAAAAVAREGAVFVVQTLGRRNYTRLVRGES